jgi:PAS domain S-box-containing protein
MNEERPGKCNSTESPQKPVATDSEREPCDIVLRESKAELDRVQKITHLGSYVWDIRTGKGTCSDEFYHILGVQKGTVEPDYQTYLQLVHPEDRQRVVQTLQDAVASGTPGGMDYRIIRPDGTVRWVHGEGMIIPGRNGEVQMYGTIQDITERKRTEEALKAARAQAELYLDLMGHDINNMHQIALGYLEMARDTIPVEEDQKEYLDKPIEVLQRSAQLISNVRKMQKLMDERLPVRVTDLREVLVSVQREYGSIPHKPVSLDIRAIGGCRVLANDLLHDVFSNLVTNAIKHTGDRASIAIVLENLRAEGRPYCQVSVSDNGPGVSDDFKDVIFNRMLKGTTRSKGMGIGLYLVKWLVESFGGRVWVEDRVTGDHTQGARFVVMLPVV